MKNNLLQLKGDFLQEKRPPSYGRPKIKNDVVIEHLKSLLADLISLKKYWNSVTIIDGALIDVYYTKIVPKSSRINKFLSLNSKNTNDTIVGVRFNELDGKNKKHIFTHYVNDEILSKTISWLVESINIVASMFNGKITPDIIEKINNKECAINSLLLKNDDFVKLICDASLVEKFDIPKFVNSTEKQTLVSLYNTNIDVTNLMRRVGIRLLPDSILNNTTIRLSKKEFDLLKDNASYLIAMSIDDEREFTETKYLDGIKKTEFISIPKPTNEPIIGVIDKIFDQDVYFSEWVESHDLIDKTLREIEKDDYHGTSVSSIIVDGPSANPLWEDGCGRFRVRHFAVAIGKTFSSFTMLKNIQKIVSENRDIKVWNISLGSILEINKNYISPEAAILDQIQYENDVIFVIAGTNDAGFTLEKRIGAPADSINSLVVNSVNMKKQPASYARRGPVLSFFHKPDVSYYGGDTDKYISVCTPLGEKLVMGTSFATPWIARKLAYLIHILKFSREVAKALIIDAAAQWNDNVFDEQIGYGVVPKLISDVVESNKDEIKFFFYSKSEKYNTFTYNIPVPMDENDKFPFIAKATLSYFPACSRNQGVDYTNTEFDIGFGRMSHNKIKTINNNVQADTTDGFVFEEDARDYYRKWDNVKHIQEKIKPNVRARDSYETSLWGLSIKTKERLSEKFGEGLNFGVVITLKEIKGRNRIDEFIRQCVARGWIVNKIEIKNRIEIYNKAEENIVFDE